MKVTTSPSGFPWIEWPVHPGCGGSPERLVQQSSMIDFEVEGGLEKPGSSYLWIGAEHHLNRAEVAELVTHLQAWLATGRLEVRA